jgi:hypothetical protein
MSKASEFVEILRGRVGRSIYVWGGDGELMSSKAAPEKWIRENETSSANAERAIALYRQLLSEGITDIRAFDCRCKECRNESKWEWRGAREGEGNANRSNCL